MGDIIESIQNAFFYKKGSKITLTESEKNLAMLYDEEELKTMFYEKTLNIKPETVTKSISHIKNAINKLPKKDKVVTEDQFNKILDGWKVNDEAPFELEKLQQEDLRNLYRALIDLSRKNSIKLPLEEYRLSFIEIPIESSLSETDYTF
jgi:hypothetical protein